MENDVYKPKSIEYAFTVFLFNLHDMCLNVNKVIKKKLFEK